MCVCVFNKNHKQNGQCSAFLSAWTMQREASRPATTQIIGLTLLMMVQIDKFELIVNVLNFNRGQWQMLCFSIRN